MSAKRKGSSDPFALLVDAANAQSEEESSATKREIPDGSSNSLEAKAYREASEIAQAGGEKIKKKNRENCDVSREPAEWERSLRREALEREALEQEAMERDMMFRQAGMTRRVQSGGRTGAAGLYTRSGSLQDADYLQQLRLEALVQQRRQETFAQLALVQEMEFSHDYHALLQAEQYRQAARLRQQEELLVAGDGGLGMEQFMSAGYYGYGKDRRFLDNEIYPEEQLRKDRYEEQQRLANLSFGGFAEPLVSNKMQDRLGTSPPSPHQSNAWNQFHPFPPPSLETLGKSGTVIIPCPARGMPPDHVPETAYFTLSGDTKHGKDLVCSYYACRNAGAQFRFCAYCNLPVSKWNFEKMHKHEEEQASLGMKNDREPKSRKCLTTPSRSIDASIMLAKLVELGAEEVEAPKKGTKKDLNTSGRTIDENRDERLRVRQGEWDRLLESRPRDVESLVSWVRKVLVVSDVDAHDTKEEPPQSKEVELPVDEDQGEQILLEPKQEIATNAEKDAQSDDEAMTSSKAADDDDSTKDKVRVDKVQESKTTKTFWEESDEADDDNEAGTKVEPVIEQGERKSTTIGEEGKPDSALLTIVSDEADEKTKRFRAAVNPAEKKEEDVIDDESASSEESVDLRASKKLKLSQPDL